MKSRRPWLQAHLRDPYVQAAQKDGYRSRAAYKLQEIDERFGLLRPGGVAVDLGSAPGAWCQYLKRHLKHGHIIALDLLPMEAICGVQFIQGDFLAEATWQQLMQALPDGRADLVLSDMAPNLTGQASVDAARCVALVEQALDFAVQHLGPRGMFLTKTFHGSGHEAFLARMRQSFARVHICKPKASRNHSAEIYLLGREPRPANPHPG